MSGMAVGVFRTSDLLLREAFENILTNFSYSQVCDCAPISLILEFIFIFSFTHLQVVYFQAGEIVAMLH